MTDNRGLLDTYLAPKTTRGADPLDTALDNDARDRGAIVYFSQRQADAEKAARANRLARSVNLPADTVERNFGAVQADADGRAGAAIVRQLPGLGAWYSDPRNAAASHDDVASLGALTNLMGPNSPGAVALGMTPESLALKDWAARRAPGMRDPRDIPFSETLADAKAAQDSEMRHAQRIASLQPKASAGSLWTGIATGTVGGFRQAYLGAQQTWQDWRGDAVASGATSRRYQEIQDIVDASTPRDLTPFGHSLYGGAISTVQAVPALAAGLLTDGLGAAPWLAGLVGAGAGGAQSGFSAYGKYRARGATIDQARLGASAEGAIEVGTEYLPMEAIASKFGKTGFKKFAGELLAKEMFGEQVATFTQDAVDTQIAHDTAAGQGGALDPGSTWNQYWKDRPQAFVDTAVAVLMQSGAVGGVHSVVHALRPVEIQQEHAVDAIAGANLLDGVMSQAEASKLRVRDPEAFQQFIAQHTEGGAVEHVYVPAEKLRELMQSDAFDASEWDWAPDLAGQLQQASASGGDVVLPFSGVAAHLAGTKSWEAIRDDVAAFAWRHVRTRGARVRARICRRDGTARPGGGGSDARRIGSASTGTARARRCAVTSAPSRVQPALGPRLCRSVRCALCYASGAHGH